MKHLILAILLSITSGQAFAGATGPASNNIHSEQPLYIASGANTFDISIPKFIEAFNKLAGGIIGEDFVTDEYTIRINQANEATTITFKEVFILSIIAEKSSHDIKSAQLVTTLDENTDVETLVRLIYVVMGIFDYSEPTDKLISHSSKLLNSLEETKRPTVVLKNGEYQTAVIQESYLLFHAFKHQR